MVVSQKVVGVSTIQQFKPQQLIAKEENYCFKPAPTELRTNIQRLSLSRLKNKQKKDTETMCFPAKS
jgi:hypothetical protein